MTHNCFTTLLFHNIFCFILICDAQHNHFIFSSYKVLFTFCFMPVHVAYSLSPSSAPFLPCPVGNFTCVSSVFTILHHFSYLFFLAHTSKCVYYRFSFVLFSSYFKMCLLLFQLSLLSSLYFKMCLLLFQLFLLFSSYFKMCLLLFIRHENVLFLICLRNNVFYLADLKMGVTSSLVVQVLNLV